MIVTRGLGRKFSFVNTFGLGRGYYTLLAWQPNFYFNSVFIKNLDPNLILNSNFSKDLIINMEFKSDLHK
jgi:hypothetical protein